MIYEQAYIYFYHTETIIRRTIIRFTKDRIRLVRIAGNKCRLPTQPFRLRTEIEHGDKTNLQESKILILPHQRPLSLPSIAVRNQYILGSISGRCFRPANLRVIIETLRLRTWGFRDLRCDGKVLLCNWEPCSVHYLD